MPEKSARNRDREWIYALGSFAGRFFTPELRGKVERKCSGHSVTIEARLRGDIFLPRVLLRDGEAAQARMRTGGPEGVARYQDSALNWRWADHSNSICTLTLVGGMLAANSKALTESLNANLSVIKGRTSILPASMRLMARG